METANALESDLSLLPVGDIFRTMPYNKALRERMARTAVELERNPDKSFPCALGQAGYTAFLRMIHNPRVLERPPLEAVIQDAVARATSAGLVLAIHDTTELHFGGKKRRVGLGRLNKNDQGFLGHFSLAATADGSRQALGLLSVQTIVRQEENVSGQSDLKRYLDPNKESLKWQRGIAEVRERLAGKASVVHVADRESDDYALFCDLVDNDDRFVLRLNYDRLLASAPSGLPPGVRKVREAFAHLIEGLCEREVPLSPRPRSSRPDERKKQPPRQGRLARLRFQAMGVELRRPDNVPKELPATLKVNIVAVREIDPPAGEEPVGWWLITREPIDTAEQVLQVVDWYRARWLIEELNKALKTGCAYEKRQLESLGVLQIALYLLLPIAVNLLRLRSTAQHAPETPASEVLDQDHVDVLRETGRKRLPDNPTVRAVLLAIAALGGHLVQNGEPGWLVLSRGMQVLEERVLAWRACREHLAELSAAKARKKCDLS